MPSINFNDFAYFPALCCSDGNHEGYRALERAEKKALMPIFELGQSRHDPNLDAAIELVQTSAADLPFILDISKNAAPPAYEPNSGPNQKTLNEREATKTYNALLESILDPSGGFSAWRKLSKRFPNCVPTLQFIDASAQAEDILKQCKSFAKSEGCVAIRFTQSNAADVYPLLPKLIDILTSAERLAIIIDCGQGKLLRGRDEFAATCCATIFESVPIAQRPLLQMVCLSSSFPSPGVMKIGLHKYPACEWDIWCAAQDVAPTAFGDYAATWRMKKTSTYIPGESKPTIAYPLDDGWLIYRHKNSNDEQGWIDGAKLLKDHTEYPPPLEAQGRNLIDRAAASDLENGNSSRFWLASKVNLHLHRQLKKAQDMVGEIDGDDEF